MPDGTPATLTALPSGSQVPTNASGPSSSAQLLNENNFLQLLTAQLEHQDPLNPMTGDQFAAELAVDRATARLHLTEGDDRTLIQEFAASLGSNGSEGGRN